MSSTRQLIKLAMVRTEGETIGVSKDALVELGAQELMHPDSLKAYRPGPGRVEVKKTDIAPFLEKAAPKRARSKKEGGSRPTPPPPPPKK